MVENFVAKNKKNLAIHSAALIAFSFPALSLSQSNTQSENTSALSSTSFTSDLDSKEYSSDLENQKALYTYDQQKRIQSITYSSGVIVSQIEYLPHSDRIFSFHLKKENSDLIYSRTHYKNQYYNRWNIRHVENPRSAASQWNGDVVITKHGEYALYSHDNNKDSRWDLYNSDGTISPVKIQINASIQFLNKDNQTCLLRRPNGTTTKIEYINKKPASITQTEKNSTSITWNYDTEQNLWSSNKSYIKQSTSIPINTSSGLLSYTLKDGREVVIASSGVKTFKYQNGKYLIFKANGLLHAVHYGAKSRRYSFSENHNEAAYVDCYGKKEIKKTLSLPQSIELAELLKNFSEKPETCNPSDSRSIINPTFLIPSERTFVIPKIPQHIHELDSYCSSIICPSTAISETNTRYISRSGSASKKYYDFTSQDIATWTDLEELRSSSAYGSKYIVNVLKVWSKHVSEEDIHKVTSRDFLKQFVSDNGDRWFDEDLLDWSNSDFIIWLQKSIDEGRLPCHIRMKPLSRSGSSISNYTDPRVLGGMTEHYTSSRDHKLYIELFLQGLNYSPSLIESDHKSIEKYGGVGLFHRKQATLLALFHELHHVWAQSQGYNIESPEPPAQLAALQCVLMISPEDSMLYKNLDKK